jgi:hypothetical protein
MLVPFFCICIVIKPAVPASATFASTLMRYTPGLTKDIVVPPVNCIDTPSKRLVVVNGIAEFVKTVCEPEEALSKLF